MFVSQAHLKTFGQCLEILPNLRNHSESFSTFVCLLWQSLPYPDMTHDPRHYPDPVLNRYKYSYKKAGMTCINIL